MIRKKIAAWTLILLLGGLLLAPHAEDVASPVENTFRGNACHFPAFLLLTLLFFWLFSRERSFPFRATAAALVVAALAIGTELIQSVIPGRTASWDDLFANFLGITAAFSGLWIWQNSRATDSRWKKGLHALLTIAIAGTLTWPYLQHLTARLACQKQFPVLSDFHNPRFALLWKPQNGSKAEIIRPLTQNRPALVVTLTGQNDFEGINYLPGSQDWSDYTSLHMTLWNPGPVFTLGIRIDDDGDCSHLNSRFNGKRLLNSGETQLAFSLEKIRTAPKNRELNLKAIRRIALFTRKAPSSQQFHIVRIWLE